MTSPTPITAPGATLSLWPCAFEDDQSLLDEIVAACEWESHTISLYGRSHEVPRLTAWCGDAGVTYRYSGLTHVATGWPPALARVRGRVQELAGAEFNSVLCNLYRDGRDSMGWHSDDEPELGPEPAIASVTLGHARPFQFRPKKRDNPDAPAPFAVELGSGSLLLMAGETQHNWQHAIAKTKREIGRRLNLTFRYIHRQLRD